MELSAIRGLPPKEELHLSVAHSIRCEAFYANGMPIAIFGAGLLKATNIRAGSIWLVGTDAISEHKRTFATETKRLIESYRQEFDFLTNFAAVKNKVSRRWLEWLGFTFTSIHLEFGVSREPFWEFFWQREGTPYPEYTESE